MARNSVLVWSVVIALLVIVGVMIFIYANGEAPVVDNNSSESNMTFCSPESRNAQVCIEIYRPVCGWNDPEKIQCIRYPCAQTYSNSCFACGNPNVIGWTEGQCPA